MEKIIELGSRRYIVGLEWMKLAGSDPLLDARAQAKDRRSPMGVVRSVDVDDQKFNQVGLAHNKAKGVIYSAAAHLANIYPSVIAVERISEDLYWLCFAENGRVLPGYDVAATDSEIKQLYIELSSEYTLEYMTLVMTEEISNFFDINEPHHNISPFELLRDDKTLEGSRLKRLGGIPNTVYLGLALVATCGGMFGYWNYTEQQRALEMARMEQQALEAQLLAERTDASKGPTQQELLDAARKEELQWLKEDISTQPLYPLALDLLALSEVTPSRREGWQLEGIVYEGKAKGLYKQFWARKHGTVSALSKGVDPEARVDLANKLDAGVISTGVTAKPTEIEDIESFISKQGMSHLQLADMLIARRLDFQVEVMPSATRAKKIEGIKDANLAQLPQLVLKRRTFNIMGQDKSSFVNLLGGMKLVNNMIPVSISIDRRGGQFKWTFSGILHEL